MQGTSTFSRKGDIMEAKSKNKGKEKKTFAKNIVCIPFQNLKKKRPCSFYSKEVFEKKKKKAFKCTFVSN